MPATVEQLLQSLRDGGLLSKEERARLEQAWPPERRGEDAKPLAIELVRQKLLTEFQALNLYHGKARFLVLGTRTLRTRTMLEVPGMVSLDAMSPDGSLLYLIQANPRNPAE